MDSFDAAELDRVGARLSQAWLGEGLSSAGRQSDLDLLEAYRLSGAEALDASVAEVDRDAALIGLSGYEVTSRIKQVSTILHKIQRMSDLGRSLGLSEMIDVLGCRIVVESQDDANRVVRQMREPARRDILAVLDYAARSKRTGYRAIHLRTRPHGRLVEVQARTRRQHSWAQRSEELQQGLDAILRDGHGPAVVQRYLRALSAVTAAEDAGVVPRAKLLAKLKHAEHELEEYHGLHDDN